MFSSDDIKQPKETFDGMYRGVVIDNNDPLENGRVKIKIMPMFSGVSDESLPWAIMADPSFGNVNTGSIKIPEINTHLWVFFENGDHRHPVYFASAPAIQNGTPDLPQAVREADVNVSNTITANKKSGISTASGGSWDEPDSAYAAVYPKNHVFKSENGILVELDDTDNAVRIHIFHPSGTRSEVDNTGNEVNHVQGNRFTVIVGNDNVYVTGNHDITIDGNCGIKIINNATIDAGGDVVIKASGDATIDSTNANVNTTADANITSGGNVNITGALINLN